MTTKICQNQAGTGCGKELPKDGEHFAYVLRYNKEGAERKSFNGLCRGCRRKIDRGKTHGRQMSGKGNRSRKQMSEADLPTPAENLFLHELVPTEVSRERRYVVK